MTTMHRTWFSLPPLPRDMTNAEHLHSASTNVSIEWHEVFRDDVEVSLHRLANNQESCGDPLLHYSIDVTFGPQYPALSGSPAEILALATILLRAVATADEDRQAHRWFG